MTADGTMSGEPLEVSPRAVLMLLNQMGITGITAIQLKAFIHDLKKLIHIDKHRSELNKAENRTEGPEKLYSRSTHSSRSKTIRSNTESSGCNKKVRVREQNNDTNKNPTSSETRKTDAPRKLKGSKCLIKVPTEDPHKKSDPVSLYHQYASLWQKYKSNMPGENDWADLRWSVREKLIREKSSSQVKKTASYSEEVLAKRREGWID